MSEWLTVAQAAEHVKVSTRTVERYISAGRLTAYTLESGRIRVKETDVDALLKPVGKGQDR